MTMMMMMMMRRKTKSRLTEAEPFKGRYSDEWVDGGFRISIYAKGQLFPFAAWSFIKSLGIIKQSRARKLRNSEVERMEDESLRKYIKKTQGDQSRVLLCPRFIKLMSIILFSFHFPCASTKNSKPKDEISKMKELSSGYTHYTAEKLTK